MPLLPLKIRTVVELLLYVRTQIMRKVDEKTIPMVYRFVSSLFSAYVRELSLLNYFQPEYVYPTNMETAACGRITGTRIGEISTDIRNLVYEMKGNGYTLDFESLCLLLDSWVPEGPGLRNPNEISSYNREIAPIKQKTREAIEMMTTGEFDMSQIFDIFKMWVNVLGTVNGVSYSENPVSAYTKLPISTAGHGAFQKDSNLRFISFKDTITFARCGKCSSQFMTEMLPGIHVPRSNSQSMV